MSDEIKKCRTCGTRVRDFEQEVKDGSSVTCRCPECGHRYVLFFMPGTRANALVLEDLGLPSGTDRAPAETGIYDGGAGAASASERPEAAAGVAAPTRATDPGSQGPEVEAATPDPSSDHLAETVRGPDTVNDEAEAGSGAEGNAEKRPHSVNIAVGRKVRELRMLNGLSQEKLAHRVGITFQQVQKYERGTNRITPERLMALAQALGVPVSKFFEDVEQGDSAGPRLEARDLQLVRVFQALNEREREHVFRLVRAISNAHESPSTDGDALKAAE